MKQRIPFVGPSYQARSANADAQRTVNCYLEMDNASPRAPAVLYGRPGLELLGTIGNGPIRTMLAEKNILYVVSANEVYKVIKSGSVYGATFLGNIGTSTGPVGIASNGSQILIVDGVGGWIVTTATSVFAVIASANFPNGVTRATYQDQYFIVTGNGTQKFYISKLADGTTWGGLDFASAEGAPDNTIACISDHRELLLFGNTSVEVWTNTGAAAFPFQRSGNAFIEHGCAAADTVAKLDNTTFWLGLDDRGGATVWRLNGYTPARVSNHPLEKAMQGYSIISDARAFTYQQEGHSFYVLSFPTADKTWVYDAASNDWFEWTTTDGFNVDRVWRAACHVYFGQDHLVGDYVNGKFYRLNLDIYLDDGQYIRRLRATQSEENLQQRLFFGQLQVDMETGVGGTLNLRYSDDGGHTWSNIKTASMGTAGVYDARCIYRRLGTARNRIWEISTTSNVKFAILGAVVDMEQDD